MSSSSKQLLTDFLDELLASGGVSCAVALIGTPEGILISEAVGEARASPSTPAEPGTWFDLASLTKPVVATLAVVLDEAGDLPLSLELGEVFSGAHPELGRRRLAQLLRHRSGLLPWTPLFARAHSREEARELLLGGELLAPTRIRIYSDLGYLAWMFAAEEHLGQPLELMLEQRVFAPLGIRELCPPPGRIAQVAECRLPNDKERELARDQGIDLEPGPVVLYGTPQDGNARFLGGVPGHAGLFGPAAELWRLGAEWLAPGRLLRPEGVARALAGRGRYALGWWRRRSRGHGGPALSRSAFGKVAHTGASWWLDPERQLVAVLLAHRSHGEFDLMPWRRRYHAVAVAMTATLRASRRRAEDTEGLRVPGSW